MPNSKIVAQNEQERALLTTFRQLSEKSRGKVQRWMDYRLEMSKMSKKEFVDYFINLHPNGEMKEEILSCGYECIASLKPVE